MHARVLPCLTLALALAACAPAPAPVAPPSATPAPTPAPVATPATSPTPAPAATTPAPVASVPIGPTGGGTVAGTVHGLDGKPLAGVTVAVRSLDAALPYAATATTGDDGRFTTTSVHRGVELEVVATRTGWTPRRQVVALAGDSLTVDFGGPGLTAPLYLSDHPEIASTRPARLGRLEDRTRLVYAVTLSEPLPPADRERFAAALRVLPANDAASADVGAEEVAFTEDRYPLERSARAFGPWSIGVGTSFRARAAGRARLDWSEDGLTATLTFGAPMIADRTETARYQVVLEAGALPIADAQGLPLGTGPTGALGTWPAPGGLVLGAFRALEPRIRDVEGLEAGTPAARWASTHDNASVFTVAEDGDPPLLTETRVERKSGDTLVKLVFDEPLIAYNGREAGLVGAGTGASAADLQGITFAVGERGDLTSDRLDGEISSAEITLDPRAVETFGEETGERRREVAFDAAAWAASGAGAPDGTVTLGIDDAEANVLVLTIHGRRDFFGDAARQIQVRVEGVGDPARNKRDKRDADANIITSDI